MITITRRHACSLRGILRRAALGLARKGPAPPLVFQTDGAQLRAYSRYNGLAIAHAVPDRQDVEAITLPFDALGELEGRDDSPITLALIPSAEAVGTDRTIARWTDRGVPQSRTYDVPTIGSLGAMPTLPESWSTAPAGLLEALAEAALTAGEASPRYALDCVQLGGDGSIAATDGRQVLIQRGFSFPCTREAIVRLAPLFAGRGLPQDQAVEIANVEGHIALRVGPWTLWLEIREGDRFPDLRGVIPSGHDVPTRLQLDPSDATFLAGTIDRLPGADQFNAPATLDLNGRIALRAQGDDPGPATELVLARSRYSGPSKRLVTNRVLLARAARLGFAEIEVGAYSDPLVCRDARRCYAWVPLAGATAIPPSDDVIRIESTDHPDPAPRPALPRKPRNVMPERTEKATSSPPAPTSNETSNPTGLAALITEAVALHELLGGARTRTAKLIGALRRERKRSRLLSSTLAQLRELRLQEVAD
jgi:hypothetical protein